MGNQILAYRNAFKCLFIFNISASCDPLTPPAHGSCSADPCFALEGGRLNFTCDNGYLLEGANDLICLNNAKYTAAVPQCVGEVEPDYPPSNCYVLACNVGICPAFSTGPNVLCSPSCSGITVGHTITFSCKQGYALPEHQSTVASCRADRIWSISSSPVCKSEPIP